MQLRRKQGITVERQRHYRGCWRDGSNTGGLIRELPFRAGLARSEC